MQSLLSRGLSRRLLICLILLLSLFLQDAQSKRPKKGPSGAKRPIPRKMEGYCKLLLILTCSVLAILLYIFALFSGYINISPPLTYANLHIFTRFASPVFLISSNWLRYWGILFHRSMRICHQSHLS